MKDLNLISKKEQNDFFRSFDYVFCDVDGVLWHCLEKIPGSLEAITTLQTQGKKVIFVSNNSTKTPDTYFNELKSAGYNLDKTDLIQPAVAMVDFLKMHKITKKVYLIGMTPLRTQLEEAGFTVEQYHLDNPEESTAKHVKACTAPPDNVGVVLVDLDLNMRTGALQRAATYLKNPEIAFVTGGSDKKLCYGPGQIVIGPGQFHAILEDMTGRKPHCLAKPSREFGDFINKKFGIKDPSRVLFIGDSVPEDMGFATNCGYQKLLVLSGLTTKENVEKWSHSEEYKPQYYVDSLKKVQDILSN